MKNLLTFALLFCIHFSYAQVQKGTVVVGGRFGLSGYSENNDASSNIENKTSGTNFNITPGVEKFVSNSFAIGFGLSYDYKKNSTKIEYQNSMQEFGSKRNMISVGPALTKYISLREKLYLTIGGSLRGAYGSDYDIDTEEKSNIWSLTISASPGIAFFLNDNFALSAGIGSLYYAFESEIPKDQNTDEKLKDTRSDYGLTFSFNTFNVGLKYFLRTAKSE